MPSLSLSLFPAPVPPPSLTRPLTQSFLILFLTRPSIHSRTHLFSTLPVTRPLNSFISGSPSHAHTSMLYPSHTSVISRNIFSARALTRTFFHSRSCHSHPHDFNHAHVRLHPSNTLIHSPQPPPHTFFHSQSCHSHAHNLNHIHFPLHPSHTHVHS